MLSDYYSSNHLFALVHFPSHQTLCWAIDIRTLASSLSPYWALITIRGDAFLRCFWELVCGFPLASSRPLFNLVAPISSALGLETSTSASIAYHQSDDNSIIAHIPFFVKTFMLIWGFNRKIIEVNYVFRHILIAKMAQK